MGPTQGSPNHEKHVKHQDVALPSPPFSVIAKGSQMASGYRFGRLKLPYANLI